MKVYTRKGDGGETRLLSGERVGKDDRRVDTYGALDELQAQLGMARAMIACGEIQAQLHAVQCDLFTASAELAISEGAGAKPDNPIGEGTARKLEGWIDDHVARWGLPDRFVVPGETRESAALHVARTVCRRCERLIVGLNRREPVGSGLLTYFNRLSDLLFTIAWGLELESAVKDAVEKALLAKTHGGAS